MDTLIGTYKHKVTYGNHWAFIVIIGCVSAIQASLNAFDLYDDSARFAKSEIKM